MQNTRIKRKRGMATTNNKADASNDEIKIETNKVQALTTKIEQERELSQKFRIEVEGKWKEILSQEKIESLQDQTTIDTLKTRYQQEWNKKKELIQSLSRALRQGEDQRCTAVASHLQTVEDMIRGHVNQLSAVDETFQSKVSEIRKRYNKGRREIIQQHDIGKTALLQEIKDVELESKRMAEKDAMDQQQELGEIRNKNLDDINSLRFILDSKIEDLDEHFDLAKNEYLQKTDFQSESLQKQHLRGDKMSKEAMILQHKIEKLSLAVKKIQRISNRKAMQNNDRCDQLTRRKSEIISRYKRTKTKMEDLRMTHHRKLKELTKRASMQKQDLEDDLFRVENTLKMTKIISKLEHQNGLTEVSKIESSPKAVCSLHTQAILERYNKVLLHYEQIKTEENDATERNRELSESIERFRNGITVNDDVMLNCNPLFVVNGKMHP